MGKKQLDSLFIIHFTYSERSATSDRFYKYRINYMEVIFDICRKEKITAILSLIDPELSLLAKHEK